MSGNSTNTGESEKDENKIILQPREISKNAGKQESVVTLKLQKKAEVTRLDVQDSKGVISKKPESVKFQKREEEPAVEEVQEREWGESSSSLGKWIWISGAVLALVLVIAVFLSNRMEGLAMEEVEPPDIPLVTGDPFEGNPEQWFRQRAGGIGDEAIILMRKYLKAEDARSRSFFVRNPERYLKLVDHWPMMPTPRLSDINEKNWEISHTEQTAFLLLETEDENFLPMQLYFIRQGEELKFDWEATVAWSEQSIANIKKASVSSESVLVRCLLRRRNEFYVGPYNDKEHAAYMILSSDKEDYLWAYVNRGSELDEALRRLLDHGSFVVDLKKDIRVTLRVRAGKKDALPSQLELIELVHPEWVRP